MQAAETGQPWNVLQLRRTDKFVALWMVLTPLAIIHVSLTPDPLPRTYLYNALLYGIGAVLSYHNATIRKIFILASIAGVVELLGDHFLVTIADSLVYPYFLPPVLSSPLYMPLAWAIAITQIGYIAVRVDELVGRWAAILVPSITAMVVIGFYESFAHTAGIWSYVTAPGLMIGHAPLYIILAEGTMFATLAYFLRWKSAVVGGVGFGLVINASYVACFYLLGLL